MAEVSATRTVVNSAQGKANLLVTWGAINTNNQTAAIVEMPDFNVKSVHFHGSNFDGATISLHGSNDGTNFIVLTDPQGTNIAKTASSIEQVQEHTRFIRPVGASIGTNTSVVVTVYGKAL